MPFAWWRSTGWQRLDPLLLDTAALTMDGGGSVNLGTENLDLTLRPQGRVGGTGVVVPLRMTGPIRSPEVRVNAIGAAASNAGAVAGAVLGDATPLGAIGGALLGGKATGAAAETCAHALPLARGEAAPSARASEPAATPAPSNPSNPANLLKQLFH